MNHWTLFLIRLLAISIFPIILKKFKRVVNGAFDLTNLSKMLFALCSYYFIGDILLKKVSLNADDYYWFTTVLNGILTSVYIIAVLRYSPIKNNIKRIINFPTIKSKSFLYKVIILFFFLKAVGIYLNVAIMPERTLKEGSLLLYTVINEPYVTIPIFLFITLFSAIGEELVFRYFAINALLPIFNAKAVIILSALIWTLIHQSFSLETIIFGIFLSYFYIKTGYLSICILLHALSNLVVATGAFYVHFSDKNVIHISPIVYASVALMLLMGLYYIISMFMRKRPCEALDAGMASC